MQNEFDDFQNLKKQIKPLSKNIYNKAGAFDPKNPGFWKGITPKNKKNIPTEPNCCIMDQVKQSEHLLRDHYFSENDDHELFFTKPGLQHKKLKKLQQGKIKLEKSIDLHGHTLLKAKKTLLLFIEECYYHNLQYLHVIHGKSLNNKDRSNTIQFHAKQLLKQHPKVLGFCSAPPYLGSTGSTLIILKRNTSQLL